MYIIESSPDTVKGSISQDLNRSKVWMFEALKKKGLTSFDTIYMLGTWYGSMNYFLLRSKIEFKQAINIEIDREKVEFMNRLIKKLGDDRLSVEYADANEFEYVGDNVLVINTSTNDIEGKGWLRHIPYGTACVFQGKNHQENNQYIDSLRDFDNAFPLNETILLDRLLLEDVHGNPYHRYMKIGYR